MRTLGIYTGHDCGVAVVEDGVVTHAMEEERLRRQKHAVDLPGLALEWLEKSYGITPHNVDIVARGTPTNDHTDRVNAARYVGLDKHELGKYQEYDHHLCHLATAYLWSGWDDCYAIAIDGGGKDWFSRAAKCSNGKIDILTGEPMTEDRTLVGTNPGSFYLFMTLYLGFKPNHDEGKVQALAASGDPNRFLPYFYDRYEVRPFDVVNRGSRFERGTPTADEIYELAGGKEAATTGQTRADLAAATQAFFEDMMLTNVRSVVPKGERLAVCGGSFANVSLNRKLLDWASSVWIAPSMIDSGIATGAAMLGGGVKPHRLNHVFLGNDVGAIDTSKWDPKWVAKKLDEGAIVGICQGRSEHGPRALGNRTIIADPRRVDMSGRVNAGLKRSSLMPFAPAIPIELADEFLEPDWRRAAHAAEFMTITFKVRDGWKEKTPCVVHLDNTARPQVVRSGINPFLHAVLTEFYTLTECPVLIQTSQNMHGTPIVGTLEDAKAVLNEGGVDILVSP